MSTLESLRAKSRYIAPSTKRTPNVRDIAKALGEYYGVTTPLPMPPISEHDPDLNSSPPSSPPQWDLNSPGKSPPDIPDYLRTPVSRYSSQSSSDSFLQFSTPSTGPQTLLHPVFPFSPETAHILPALHVSDPPETPEPVSPPVVTSNPISPLNVGVALNAVGGENSQSSHPSFNSIPPSPPHEDIQITSPPQEVAQTATPLHEAIQNFSPPNEAIQITSLPNEITQISSPPHKVIQTSILFRRFCDAAIQTDDFQDVAVQTDMTSSPPQVLQHIEVQVETEHTDEAPAQDPHSRGVGHVDPIAPNSDDLGHDMSDPEDLVQHVSLGSEDELDLMEGGLQQRVLPDVTADNQFDVPTPLVLPITDTATNASSDHFVTPTSETGRHEVPVEQATDPAVEESLEASTPNTHHEELSVDYDTPDVVSLSNTGDSSDADMVESSYVSVGEDVIGSDSALDSESERRSEGPSTASVANTTPPDWDAWEPLDHSDTSEAELVHHDLSADVSSQGVRTSSDGTFASDEGLSLGEDMLEDLLEEVGGSGERGESPEPLIDASVLSPTVVELEPREFSDERPLSIPSLPDELIDFNETLSEAETIPDEHDPEAQKQAAHSSGRSSPFQVFRNLHLPSSPDIVPITPPLVPRRKLRGEFEPLELVGEKAGDVDLNTDNAGDDGILVSSADAAEPESGSTPSLVQVDLPSHSTKPDSSKAEEDGVLVPIPEGEDQNEDLGSQMPTIHPQNLTLPEVSITPAIDSVPTIRPRVASPVSQGADGAASSPALAIFSPRAFANPSPLPPAPLIASPVTTLRSPRTFLSTTPLRTASPAPGLVTASDPSPTGGASAGLSILAPIHHDQERSMEHEDLNDWHNIAEKVHQETKPTNTVLVDRLDVGRGGLRSRSASPRRLGTVRRGSEESSRPAPSQVYKSPDISSRLRSVVTAAAVHPVPDVPASSLRGQAWLQRPQGTPPPRQLEAGLAHQRRDASPAYDSGDAADSSDFDVESGRRWTSMRRREPKKTQNLSDVSQGISTKISGLWNTWVS